MDMNSYGFNLGSSTSDDLFVNSLGFKMVMQSDVNFLSENPVNKASDTAVIATSDDSMLSRYGLSPIILESTKGQVGAEQMANILASLDDEIYTPLSTRQSLADALHSWYFFASNELRERVFKQFYYKMIEIIRLTLIGSDEKPEEQRPSQRLAQFLEKYCKENKNFADFICKDILAMLRSITQTAPFICDETQSILNGVSDGHTSEKIKGSEEEFAPDGKSTIFQETGILRAITLKCIVQCLPKTDAVMEKENLPLLQVYLDTVFSFFYICSGSFSLQECVVDNLIEVAATVEDQKLIEPYLSTMTSALEAGHVKALLVLQKSPGFDPASSVAVQGGLHKLLASFGFAETRKLFERVVESDPRKLAPSARSLIEHIQSSPSLDSSHQIAIFSILLSVALFAINEIKDALQGLARFCINAPHLFVPFFKLLSVIGCHSDESALHCMQIVCSIARSRVLMLESDQHALLELINVLKDHIGFCNIFSKETLSALAEIAPSNPTAIKNIMTWNKGQGAKRGDRRSFLMQGGREISTKQHRGILGFICSSSPHGNNSKTDSFSSSSAAVSPLPVEAPLPPPLISPPGTPYPVSLNNVSPPPPNSLDSSLGPGPTVRRTLFASNETPPPTKTINSSSKTFAEFLALQDNVNASNVEIKHIGASSNNTEVSSKAPQRGSTTSDFESKDARAAGFLSRLFGLSGIVHNKIADISVDSNQSRELSRKAKVAPAELDNFEAKSELITREATSIESEELLKLRARILELEAKMQDTN